MPGTLFVVATPIGNLEDVTMRALRILREVRLIAAEDTRRTAKLLAHYDIRTSVVSLREHNEARETPKLLRRLAAGEDIALVSDAGTPVVSDPGARLVRAAREAGLPVSPIPGPSAVTAALSVSGFPGDRFVFMGYPPASGQERQDWFDAVREETRTVVFFESPHRVSRTIADLSSVLVTRPMMLARELTKIHEELVDNPTTTEGLEKGEIAAVLGPALEDAKVPDSKTVTDLVWCLTNTLGVSEDEAAALTAKAVRVPLSKVKKAVKLARYAEHQRSQLDD